MKNKVLLICRDELNEFTKVVKEICLRDGKCHVKLRNGSWVDVKYQSEIESKGQPETFFKGDWDAGWSLDGSSYTSFEYDMVEVDNK